jgi:hypothetical protein
LSHQATIPAAEAGIRAEAAARGTNRASPSVMPFLPFVLLFAWQAVSKSASFALGWATALFFGQVPGTKGRYLSIIALISAAWVVVLVGFALPLTAGWLLERAGILSNFDLAAIEVWGLTAAMILTPPALAALSEWAEFDGSRSLSGWIHKVPMSYPAAASLGLSVLQMVVITPFLVLDRVRHGRRLLEVPLVLQGDASARDLSKPIIDALHTLRIGSFERSALTGPISWPLRTAGFAARHLLGRVVRGDPILLSGDDLRVIVYATNVGILGAEGEAHRARAAIEKELAFSRAFLTWSSTSQAFEEELRRLYRAHRREDRDNRDFTHELDELQDRMDAAPLQTDEWNLLYRLRLQLQREAQDGRTTASSGSATDGAEERQVAAARR